MERFAIENTGEPLAIERLPVPFFRQLAREERSEDELALVKRAIDLARTLYVARLDFDGGPAICHGMGTASICAQLGLPINYVAFALVHNVYVNGDFGDGPGEATRSSRRQLVRSYVGAEVEGLVHERCSGIRSPEATSIDHDESTKARMELVEYADLIEKWENGRIWAASPDRADRRYVAENRERLIGRAEELYGRWFADVFTSAISHPDDLPDSARTGMVYGTNILPIYAVHHSELDARTIRARVRRPVTSLYRSLRSRAGRFYRKVTTSP
jgi:hypothetical protein